MTCRCVVLLLFHILVALVVGGVSSKLADEEPHDYTISFFQFNPKDIGVSSSKKISKKDIKASDDAPKNNTQKMAPVAVTTVTNGKVTDGNTNNTKSDLEKVKDWKDITNTTKIEITNKSTIDASNSTQQTNQTTTQANILNANTSVDTAIKTTPNANTSSTPVDNTTTTSLLNSTNTSNGTSTNSTQKRSKISNNPKLPTHKKETVLNPNPHPSSQEAELKIKNPSTEIGNQETQKTFNESNQLIYQKNTTKKLNSGQSAKLENSEKLVKVATEPAPKNEKTKSKKLSKLEKDKKRNEEIQANAKKIQPVKNMVDLKVMKNNPFQNVKNTVHDDNIQKNTHNAPPAHKKTNVMSKEGKIIKNLTNFVISDNKKSTILAHRANAKKLLPDFKEGKKDHNLTFQLGSLKHPKHDIYPSCYKCGPNSTYSDCLKRTSKITCNKDLSNICYTKSTKKNDVITYEMGCADHHKCRKARAFPCNDGTKQCFTCCQFDGCNSSPHHGDFELDELNLDELQLETHGASGTILESKKCYFLLSNILVTLVLTYIF